MKKLLMGFATMTTLSLTSVGMAANDSLNNTSYALGYQFGSMMHQMQATVSTNAYNKGLTDGLKGKASKLSQSQTQSLLMNFQQQMQAKGKQMMQAQAADNAEKGAKFLADNKTKKGVVTLPSGLQYKVLEQGSGKKPTANDTVTVDYEGRLINGKIFDSSYKRGQPATFPLNGVIPGWTEGLQLMPVGSTYELFIPANLAYGSRSVPGIGPNQALIFKVHLISIK